MHSSQSRSRRQQDNVPDEDDVMSRLASRRVRDDHDRGTSYADYSQPNSDSYRHSSYDVDVPSSRHGAADWRAPDPSRPSQDSYYQQESYHRGPHEGYETDTWSSRPQSRYPNTQREWTEPSVYPKPVYPEPAWPAASSSTQYDRHSSHENWGRDDARHVRNEPRTQPSDAKTYNNWRREETRDSGWSTRTKQKDRSETSRPVVAEPRSETRDSADDRLWQPAPSWQPNQSRQGEPGNSRQQNRPAYTNNKGKMGKKKKKQLAKQQAQYRDTTDDSGHVNNWQRGDVPANPRVSPQKRKPARPSRSPSRSRSRSVSSYSSRHSSRRRSRTRSRSRTPQRDRGSSPGHRYDKTRTSAKKVSSRPRRSRSLSRSRSPEHTRRRGRTPSTNSSRSRSRTRTPSPPPKPKAVHRLPQATSIHSIALGRKPSLTAMAPPRARLKDSIRTEGAMAASAAISAAADMIDLSASSLKVTAVVPSSSKDSEPEAMVTENSTPEVESTDVVATPPTSKDDISMASSTSATKRAFPADTSADERDGDQSKEITPSVTPSTILVDSRSRASSVIENISSSRTQSTVAGAHTPSISRHHSKSAKSGQLYSILTQVGEGTFGKVYKARNTLTGVYVALKRIRMESERDGFPVTAMREIKLLQSLSHENVVRLYEMMVSDGNVYMVFEYMDHDLTGILSQTQFTFTDAHLKSFCQQMLKGLEYLHHKSVIHRDMKGSNILVDHRGVLKLADFGLARWYQKRRQSDYTNRVITLWYRPPELLFGATVYGPEVDMWSAGCIMLELFTKKPIFQGNDEIHQLDVIYKVLGTLTAERWDGVSRLPWYELVKPKDILPNHFRTFFQKWLSPAALDLAEWLLAYDPQVRASATQALSAPYFTTEQPGPELPLELSELQGEWHELETKRERAKKRRKTEGGGAVSGHQ